MRRRTNSRFACFLATRITGPIPSTFRWAADRRMADILIVIPARMASTRLPGKALADIAGEPMIVRVMRRAQAAQLGPIVVATDSEVIAARVEKADGRAGMTRGDHVSGSDRILQAFET